MIFVLIFRLNRMFNQYQSRRRNCLHSVNSYIASFNTGNFECFLFRVIFPPYRILSSNTIVEFIMSRISTVENISSGITFFFFSPLITPCPVDFIAFFIRQLPCPDNTTRILTSFIVGLTASRQKQTARVINKPFI